MGCRGGLGEPWKPCTSGPPLGCREPSSCLLHDCHGNGQCGCQELPKGETRQTPPPPSLWLQVAEDPRGLLPHSSGVTLKHPDALGSLLGPFWPQEMDQPGGGQFPEVAKGASELLSQGAISFEVCMYVVLATDSRAFALNYTLNLFPPFFSPALRI